MRECMGRFGARWVRVATVGLVVIASSLAALAAPAGAVAAGPPQVGINSADVFSLPATRWDALLSQMARDGVQVVRQTATWNAVEPSAPGPLGHLYDWGSTDQIARALAEHGLRWLPVIGYSTRWCASVWTRGSLLSPSQPNLLSPPQSWAYGDFADYAAAFVQRYGPGGAFWTQNPDLAPKPVTQVQIWNEPNTSYFWAPSPDAGQYASLYGQARAAIEGVAPGEEVVVGALANPAGPYLDQMLAALGSSSAIDAVADTPYASSASSVISAVAALRSTLDAAGDVSVPIEVSEFGWPTHGSVSWAPTMTDAQRALAISGAMTGLAGGGYGVEAILPYTWITPQQNLFSAYDWFGIINANGAETLTSRAYASAAYQIEASSG